MFTLYQKLYVLTFEVLAVKNKFIQIWHVSWHVSESPSRTSPAFTVSVNMALSKTGLRKKRQREGRHASTWGLISLKSMQCILNHIYNASLYSQQITFLFFFLVVSIKVKTLKSRSTITDRLTDRKTDVSIICPHSESPTR